jgi:hypothetical protein
MNVGMVVAASTIALVPEPLVSTGRCNKEALGKTRLQARYSGIILRFHKMLLFRRFISLS